MRSPFRKLLLIALALTLPAVPLLRATTVWAAAPALEEAQKLYDAAKFDDAIAKLREALSTGEVTGSDAVEARALMARCHVKVDNRVEAKQGFKTVLRSDPGYKLDPVTVPPDEMEVFNLAAKEIQQEQIEAGQRIPASLMFFVGTGPGDNTDLGEVQKFFGGSDKLDPQTEFGGSVRFPIRPRWSLDIELSRLLATGESNSSGTSVISDTKYKAAGIPLVVSLYWTVLPGSKFRANAFAGAGWLLGATASMDMHYFQGPYDFRFLQGDTKTGSYFHVGGEAEYMFHHKASLTGRILYRSATADNLIPDGTGLLTALQPSIPIFKNIKVDFSGVAFHVGVRGYIGY
jgi:hypothetical protein